MNHWRKFVFLLPGVLLGCVNQVTTSSRSYLSATQSGAHSGHNLRETALEVTRLFEVRGFALVDQQFIDNSGTLRLKFSNALRPLAVSVNHVISDELGSVYYVWLAPSAEGSQLSIVGKPTLDGNEPCSPDTSELACDGVSAPLNFADAMSGRNEAQTIHGVLSELALESYVTNSAASVQATNPAGPSVASERAAADALCRGQRHQLFLKAAQLADPAEREKLLKTAPQCN